MDGGEYKHVGQMLSVTLVHGGIRLFFFSERLYCCVSHRLSPQISIEEVDDWELGEKLQRANITSSVITGWDEWENSHLAYILKIYPLNVLFWG